MSIGAFAKVAGASATGGGNSIRDGVYTLMTDKVTMQTGHTGECFIAEFRVLESAANGERDDKGNPVTPNAPGSSCSLVCNLTKHESAAGNAKAYVVAALAGLGVTEDKITPEVMAWVCSPANPLRGVKIIDETRRTTNKGRTTPANAGKPLTLNSWKPVQQTEDEVKGQRAWLDGTPAKVDTGAMVPAAAAATPATFAAPTVEAKPPGGLLGGFLGMK